MPELERALSDLGRELRFPPTPDLAAAVERSLAAGRAPRRARRRWQAAAIVFAIFLLAVGTAFAVPTSRDFILERLGLRGATVERVVALPPVPPAVAGDVAPGEPVSLEEAQGLVDFEILVPASLGEPDEIAVDRSLPGGTVSLVYAPDGQEAVADGVGLLVTELRGAVDEEFIGKLVGQGSSVERATVAGGRGLWISGAPHVVFFRDGRGQVREDTLRLAGNTLLWEHGDLLLRLEFGLGKAQALEIARSFGAS